MDQIVITGIRYEGRYDFDLEQRELTTREWGWIKRLSGYLPLTVEEGFADPELITVFAAIALRRAGRIEAAQVPAVFEELSDAPFGTAITLEADSNTVEDDADSPPSVKLERERRYFWDRFEREFGTLDGDPGGLWDARLGFFSIRPGDIGEMSPSQLLGCADLFHAIYGGD